MKSANHEVLRIMLVDEQPERATGFLVFKKIKT